MKRFMVFLAVLLIAATALAACGYSFKKLDGGPVEGDSVQYNGSLAVKKGNYVYAVNGTGTQSAENDFGKPIKGAIIRFELDANGLPKEGSAQIAAPKLFYSSYAKAGLYIFGNTLYYLSPSLELDKNRNVLYNYTDVFSVNLDGTGTKQIVAGITSSSFAYKFYQADSTVYMVYALDGKLHSLDTSSGKTSVISRDLSDKEISYTNTPVFAKDAVYYTYDIEKTGPNQQGTYEKYNAFVKVAPNGGTPVQILDKNDKPLTLKYNPYGQTPGYTTDEAGAILKVTPTFVTDGGDIFYSRTEGSATYVYVMNAEGNIKLLTMLSLTEQQPLSYEDGLLGKVTDSASSTKFVIVKNTKTIFEKQYEDNTTLSTLLKGTYTALYTLSEDGGTKLYFTDSDSVLNKIDLTADGETTEKQHVAVTKSKVSTTLKPVVFNAFTLFITSSGDFTGYLNYALTDEDGKVTEPQERGYFGVLNSTDQERLDEIIAEEEEDAE